MKTVSVIMPIYNAEAFLPRALTGLAEQTLSDIEFILIDDCSTDNSYQILEKFRDAHSDQVQLLQTPKNLGPGGARNLGLEHAQGEYIGFVDSDDEITPEMFEKLYNKAKETDSDMVDSGYYIEKDDVALLHTSDELSGILDSHKRSELIVSGGYIVSKIFRHSFLEEQQLRFREHAILEDSEFLTRALATAKNIANVKEIFYKYTYITDSISREDDMLKYYTNVCNAMIANYKAVKDLPHYPEIQKAVEYLMAQLYCFGILKCLEHCNKSNQSKTFDYLRRIRKIKMRQIYYDYRENDYIKNKIIENDIQIMELNDSDPKKLISIILQTKTVS